MAACKNILVIDIGYAEKNKKAANEFQLIKQLIKIALVLAVFRRSSE